MLWSGIINHGFQLRNLLLLFGSKLLHPIHQLFTSTTTDRCAHFCSGLTKWQFFWSCPKTLSPSSKGLLGMVPLLLRSLCQDDRSPCSWLVCFHCGCLFRLACATRGCDMGRTETSSDIKHFYPSPFSQFIFAMTYTCLCGLILICSFRYFWAYKTS